MKKLLLSFGYLLLSSEAFAANNLDLASNTFILISAILVIFMSIPAIALFYGGLVRAKNMLSVLEQCLAIFIVCTLLWVVLGYSLSFSSHDGSLSLFIGSLDKVFLKGIDTNSLSGSISEFIFVAFQGAFCAISACIIVGALVERIRFSALIIAILIWTIISYFPMAHMVWGNGFIEHYFKAYDFAGGTVVHINAAIAALIGSILLGKRHDLGRTSIMPHNLPFAYLGAGLLWFGWFGFNAGSQLQADGTSALAFINTIVCPCAASLSWTVCEWIYYKKPSTLGTASGIVVGLVCITPACAYVGVVGSIFMGLIAGACCLFAVHFVKKTKFFDDSLDVFAIHGVGAIVGAILSGVFCSPSLGGVGFKGDYTSILGQVYGQFMSVIICIIWSAIASFIAFFIANKITKLRVSKDDETQGLDLSSHGERAYIMN